MPDAAAADTAETNATLDLGHWLPARCSVIANRVSACLESMYGERFGLSVPGWRIMANLGRYAPLSAKEVTERTAMNHVQVTRAVDQMEAVGLVSRKADPADRRRVELRLTRKGAAAYAEIVPLARAIEEALLTGLTGPERAMLDKLSARVEARAEEVLPDGVDWRRFV